MNIFVNSFKDKNYTDFNAENNYNHCLKNSSNSS